MEIALSVILIITSLVIILLVLLHKGKGGGLSDLFGGGVSSTLGSSSVVERNLDRITIFFGVLWFVCIVALGGSSITEVCTGSARTIAEPVVKLRKPRGSASRSLANGLH